MIGLKRYRKKILFSACFTYYLCLRYAECTVEFPIDA